MLQHTHTHTPPTSRLLHCCMLTLRLFPLRRVATSRTSWAVYHAVMCLRNLQLRNVWENTSTRLLHRQATPEQTFFRLRPFKLKNIPNVTCSLYKQKKICSLVFIRPLILVERAICGKYVSSNEPPPPADSKTINSFSLPLNYDSHGSGLVTFQPASP